jgi:WD40 repeat protein
MFSFLTLPWAIILGLPNTSGWQSAELVDLNTLVALDESGFMIVKEARTGKPTNIQGLPRTATYLLASRDGRTLVSLIVGPSASYSIIVIDVKKGDRKLVTPQFYGQTACISDSGTLLAMLRNTGPIREKWIVTMADIGTKKVSEFATFKGKEVACLRFDEAGDLIAIGFSDASIVIMKVSTRERVATLTGGHEGAISAMSFSSDGHTLVSGSEDESIVAWDLREKKVQKKIQKETGEITSVIYDKGIKSWFTLSTKAAPIQWSDKDMNVTRNYNKNCSGGYGLSISTDGKLLLVNSWSVIRVFEISSGKEVNAFVRADYKNKE